MRILCLHSAASNIPIFDEAAPDGAALSHLVRADLLEAAEARGGADEAILAATAAALAEAMAESCAAAALLTCSTLGPAAPRAGALRVDDALAREAAAAAAGGGAIEALCAVETTLAPTRALFERAARETGARVAVRLVPDAWARFRAGDADGYAALIAQAAGESAADVVALAQASMAPAAERIARPVLTSPGAGLAAALVAAHGAAG